MWFRNFDCPHRRRKVGPRRHPIPDLVQVVLQIGFELFDRLPVHPGGTLVRLNALVRLPHEPLRNVKRLILRIRLAHSCPPRPRPVVRANKPQMSQPLRSTPITGASSLLRAGPPARPHRYSTPHSFCCLTHSFSHPPLCRNEHSIGTRLPTFRVVAADQNRAVFTPDTAWPINGHPPDSSRGFAHTPVLMPSPVFRRFLNGLLSLAFLIPA